MLENFNSAVSDIAEYLRCAQRLRYALSSIDGLEVKPTKTNFMICRLKTGKSSELKEFLAKEKGILIRDASNFRGLYEGHFRIASSNDADNEELIAGIKEFIESGK